VLTLTDCLQLNDFTVFRDVVVAGGVRTYTSTFFVAPGPPRLASDPTGTPAFHFLWYRPALSDALADAAGGGMAMFVVDLAPTPEARVQLRAAIAGATGLAEATVELRSLPVRAGRVALELAGEAEGGEFVVHAAGVGPASLVADQRASFQVQLTAEGAALLWQSLHGTPEAPAPYLLRARYELVFEPRLDAVRLRTWCDVERAWSLAEAQLAVGPLLPGELAARLHERRMAGVEVTATTPLPAEQLAAMQEIGQGLLTTMLAGALFEPADPANEAAAPRLRARDRSVQTTLDHTFTEAFPVEQRLVRDGLLRIDLGPEALEEQVRRVDLERGFARLLEVTIHCPVDFVGGLVDAVKVSLEYDAELPAGTGGLAGSHRVQRRKELLFRDGVTIAGFRSELAAPELRTYVYEVEVFYKDSAVPLRLSPTATDATVLVLDVERLGVVDVEVTLGDVPLDLVRAVVVDLEYPPLGLSHQVILDSRTPSGVFRAVVRDPRPAPCRHRVAWLLSDDRRVEGPWTESSARRLPIGPPPVARERACVALIAAGSFEGLAEILVELSHEEGGAEERATFSFHAAGERMEWSPRVSDRQEFRYRVRRTFVTTDGIRRALEWTEEDGPVLVVRDELRFEVRVIPRLLDLGGTYLLALLTLEYVDAAEGVREATTLVLRDRTSEPRWSLRLGAPDRRRYTHELTLVAADGARTTLPRAESESEILVLIPPRE
jgi:hypothetical protein